VIKPGGIPPGRAPIGGPPPVPRTPSPLESLQSHDPDDGDGLGARVGEGGGSWGGEGFFELEFFEVAVGLVDGELIDAAVGVCGASDVDGFLELGATVMFVALLCEEGRRRLRGWVAMPAGPPGGRASGAAP